MSQTETPSLLHRARAALAVGDAAEAERLCLALLRDGHAIESGAATLGESLEAQGRWADAEQVYRGAIAAESRSVESRFLLGNLLYRGGHFAEAEAAYREALDLDPAHARAVGNLGAAVADQGRHEEAVALYESAIALDPAQVEPRYNLANSLRALDRLDEAEARCREVLALRPDFAGAYNNLGILAQKRDHLEQAEALHRQALRLRPESVESWTNLGLALAEQGRLDEALVCYEVAIRRDPDYADAHRNRSLAWLLMGNYAQGFPEYEWRWRCSDFRPLEAPQPRWDGSAQPGRVLLVYTEQGLGDTLQFVRYTAFARERVGQVWLVAPERLVPLLRRCPGVDRVISLGSRIQGFDLHLPLMSLPAALGTALASVPATVPYLFADRDRVERWGPAIRRHPGLRVGIAWHADPKGYRGVQRAIPLEAFAPLAELEGVRLISLQKGDGRRQIAGFRERHELVDLGEQLDLDEAAFEDTAAAMMALDLVVTCDTSIGHLAGGLGVPAWIALPKFPDWRWLMGRADTPWYPTARLFRQEQAGDWTGPMRAIAEALASLRSAAAKA